MKTDQEWEEEFAAKFKTIYDPDTDDIKDFIRTLIQTIRAEERVDTIKTIEKEAAEVCVEMLGAVIDQQGLKVQDFALLNTEQIQHILEGTIGNLSTRLYKALTKDTNNT